MTKTAFDRIASGLNEAISIARGEAEPARLHIPPELNVKAIRRHTGLSQEKFALAFGFTLEQIRSWEQSRNRPQGGVRAYLLLIGQDHRGVQRMLAIAGEKKAA